MNEGRWKVLEAQLRREIDEASADNARLRARVAELMGERPEERPRQMVRREPWVLGALRAGPATIPEIIARAVHVSGCRVAPSRATVQVALSKYRDRIQRIERPGSRYTVYGLRT